MIYVKRFTKYIKILIFLRDVFKTTYVHLPSEPENGACNFVEVYV